MSLSNPSGGGGTPSDGNPVTINQDATHRFATDAEKTAWDAKASALGGDDNYVTDAEKVKLINLTGTNTGDQDISGKSNIGHTHPQSDVTNLVTDLSNKQDTLVSATNIKTINGSTLLGSGDLTVSASDQDISPSSSRTIATNKTVVMGRKYIITGALNLTIQGDSILTII